MMSLRKKFFLVFSGFVLFFLFIFLQRSLFLDPKLLPSTLIDKPLPHFSLPDLLDPTQDFSQKDFLGKVTLLNIWATWCTNCIEDHIFIVQNIHEPHLQILGLNYKDKYEDAIAFLKNQGNPFSKIAMDSEGKLAYEWGVYGAPETFIIDKKGIVRYRFVGVLNKKVWEQTLLPRIKTYENAH